MTTRASADMELVAAAFPEMEQLDDFRMRLHLDSRNYIDIQWPTEDYPIEPLQMRPCLKQPSLIQPIVDKFTEIASECAQEQVEAGISCAMGVLEVWQELSDEQQQEEVIPESPPTDETPILCTQKYQWITSDDPIIDRKSTFQAHLCRLSSESDVKPALAQLLQSSSKIQRATHNMWAYRILENNNGTLRHDNDDDGEDAAGSRLAHLLEMKKETDALVVVSRWYGGIHLGPKRFAHISNAARDILDKNSKS